MRKLKIDITLSRGSFIEMYKQNINVKLTLDPIVEEPSNDDFICDLEQII